jgi:hypothetical protein
VIWQSNWLLSWNPDQLKGAPKEKIENLLVDKWWEVLEELDIDINPKVHMD